MKLNPTVYLPIQQRCTKYTTDYHLPTYLLTYLPTGTCTVPRYLVDHYHSAPAKPTAARPSSIGLWLPKWLGAFSPDRGVRGLLGP